jgi:hypothetical protein
MAMNMTGEVQLLASREAVWAMLNEPTVLKSCIPGCESLNKDSDNEFRAVATIKIGPVKARWKGRVRFSDLDPPNSYRIAGEGEGGVAGFAKGGAKVSTRRQGWWHIVVLPRRSADRRQARPARATSHQQRGEEDRRRFLRKFCRRRHAKGGIASMRSLQCGPSPRV